MGRLIQSNPQPTNDQGQASSPFGLHVTLFLCVCTFSLAGCSGCLSASSESPLQTSTSDGEPLTNRPVEKISPASKAESAVNRLPSDESVALDSTAREGGLESDRTEDSTKSSGSPVSGQKSASGRPQADAKSTLRTINTLRDKARLATIQKEFGNAFRYTSDAWEAARRHPEDDRLRELASELAVEIETFGKQSNSQFNSEVLDSTTRLIDK